DDAQRAACRRSRPRRRAGAGRARARRRRPGAHVLGRHEAAAVAGADRPAAAARAAARRAVRRPRPARQEVAGRVPRGVPGGGRLAGVLPGVLWLGFILSGLLGLGGTFLVERDNDCWEGLLLAPGDKSAIYLGKLAGNLAVMFFVEALVLVLFVLLFNVDL